MNNFEKWVLKQKIWVHILIALCTYGLWLIVWLVVYLKNKDHSPTPLAPTIKQVESNQNTFKAPLYDKRFVIEECDNYQHNIEDIVELEKPNMNLYEGMSASEMKDCSDEVYEIDGEETPEVILRENKGKVVHYISVCIYHSKYDRYLMVGRIPDAEQEEILNLFDKKVLIWGTFKGGNYKMVDDDGKLKLHKNKVEIELHIKIFDK